MERVPTEVSSNSRSWRSLCLREYKARSSQAKDLRSQDKAVPRDFCLDTFFFTFQHQRDIILAQAPISVRDVGQVAWMSSKWTVASADDMTREAEFAQIFVTAETCTLHLKQFERDLSVNPLITVSQTLRADFLQIGRASCRERVCQYV